MTSNDLAGQVPTGSVPAAHLEPVQYNLDTAPDKDTLATELLLAAVVQLRMLRRRRCG